CSWQAARYRSPWPAPPPWQVWRRAAQRRVAWWGRQARRTARLPSQRLAPPSPAGNYPQRQYLILKEITVKRGAGCSSSLWQLRATTVQFLIDPAKRSPEQKQP